MASCHGQNDLTGPVSASSTATVEIRSIGFNPTFVIVAPGGRVTFRNRDTVSHQIASNVHPDHQQCPQLNSPLLAAGESFTATVPQEDHRSCGFHDEQRFNDPGFSGTVDVCREITLFGCR
jgi:plastocyanin